MQISLSGRHALVGGASKGLGKAIAIELAASGASVTLMARNEEALKKLVTELPCAEGQQHNYLIVDFSNTEEYQKIIASFFETNPVDILINNTNGPQAGTVLEKNASDYKVAFDLLFQNVVYTTSLALPYMQQQGYGRIINTSSISVREPLPNLVLSNSIRAALATWAKTLSKEVAAHGITVNTILTGFFDTERLNELHTLQAHKLGIPMETVRTKVIQDIPARRLGNPVEYASLVAFLASDRAAYITGTQIPIDGGLLKGVW